MSDAGKETTGNETTGKKFKDMAFGEKMKFIGKTFVFLLTGGMVYPNIFSD